MAEIKFYQDAEKTIQIYPEIDPNGNFPGVTVGLANNLVSPDGNVDTDSFIFRSSGGSADLSDGYATIQKITGNASSSTIEESLTTNVNASGITAASTTTSTFRTAVSSTSGTYNFIYTPTITYSSNLVYSLDKSTFATTVSATTGTYTFNYTANVSTEDASEVISAFNQTTFINKVSQTPGTYTFEYDGNNWSLNSTNVTMSQYGITTTGSETSGDSIIVNYLDNHWAISGATVSMSNYGITTTGTESVGDSIVMTYSSNDWQLDNTIVSLTTYGITINAGTAAIGDIIQVVYVAEQIGVIVVAQPTSFLSIGLNQFNAEGDYILNGYTIDSNGNVVAASGSYVAFFRCLGNQTYTIYNTTASSTVRAAYSTAMPTTSTTGMTVLSLAATATSGQANTNNTYQSHYTPNAAG